MNRTIIATAVALGLAGAAHADPFYLELGGFGNETFDADTRTNDLDSLGWTDTQATSIYFGLTPGSTVIDTNDATYLSSLGIPGPVDPYGRLVSDLNPTGTLGDPENFTFASVSWGLSGLDGGNPGSAGSNWSLTYTYFLEGEINAAGTGVDFTSGYFDVFFEDGDAAEQVLRLNLTGFSLSGEGAGLYTVIANGNVTFDWDGIPGSDASPFAEMFFNDAESGESFYDLWFNDGDVDEIAVSWRIDNNIDCPVGQQECSSVPLADQLDSVLDGNEVIIEGFRQTTVDGTVRFAVPTPAPLALFGLGLLGLGAMRRFKQ